MHSVDPSKIGYADVMAKAPESVVDKQRERQRVAREEAGPYNGEAGRAAVNIASRRRRTTEGFLAPDEIAALATGRVFTRPAFGRKPRSIPAWPASRL